MPDKLPKGWVKTTLGEVVRILDSQRVPVNSEERKLLGGGIPYYGATGQVGFIDTHIFDEELVLLGEDGAPFLDASKPKAYIIRGKSWVNNHAHVLKGCPGMLNGFVLHQLNQVDYHHFVSGTTRMKLPLGSMRLIPFLIAPTSEQERILTKLDALIARVAAGEAAARRALERLDRYRSAVLQAAVSGELTRDWRKTHSSYESGAKLIKRILTERRAQWEEAELKRLLAADRPLKGDVWKNRYPEPKPAKTNGLAKPPRGWVWTSVDQLACGQPGAIQSGPFGSQLLHSEFVKKGILAIGIDNVLDGHFSLGSEHRITVKKYDQLKKFTARPLDVVITVMATVGRVCVLPEDIEKAIITKHCYRISTPMRNVDSRYLAITLRADAATRQHLFGNIRGQTRAGINGGILKEAPVPLPSFDEQCEIIREVERRFAAVDRLAKTLDRQLDRARATRLSLLREAFSGKLVPQDPKDEPASVLLERIRSARNTDIEEQKKARTCRGKTIRKRIKETAKMNQSIPTADDLQKAWEKIRKKPEAKMLFHAAGFGLDQVENFYGLLRTASNIVEAFKGAAKDRKIVSKVSAFRPKQATQKSGRFRLVSLWLEDFKNLKDYEVEFNSADGLDIVLGWNGTGKSNLFESLVIIFRDLHYWWEKNRWTEEPMASYRLAYEIEDRVVEVTWNPAQMKRPGVRQAAIPKKETTVPKFEPVKRENLLLPKFVFGYYSGPTNRLAEHFLPMKRDHYDRLRLAKSDDPKTLAALLEQRRFFCAETNHAKYVLLAFSYKEDPKIRQFLEDRLRIVGFESALFVIRKPRWAKGKPEEFWGATGIMRRVMEKLKRYAVAPMVQKQRVSDGYRLPSEELYYFFLPDLKSLHEFAAEYSDARSFFLALESTDFSELIHDVKIQVRVKAAENQQIPVTFRELSEGEQQLLMVLGLMRFTKSHQSLVLLDEPDTHLNPHWSVEYLKDLASVVSDDDDPSPEQQTSQLLMATHDPLVIASLVKEQVHLLKRDQETLICRWEQASVNPRGLGFTGILTSEMFGFRSDLDPETLADLDNRVRLIAKADQLSGKDRKELEAIDMRLSEAGFSKAFSDPYYAAFVRAWGKRYAEQMAGKEVLTKKETEEIDRIAKEVLAEAVAEVEKEVDTHALH